MGDLLGGLTGGGGPLGAVGGLTGGGGPLGAVGGVAGGLPVAGGMLGGGGDDGGLGGALGGVSGLAGGLLGGGEGLNLIGLVGIGSDDDALLNLNPAEHKKVKAAKAAQAAKNEQKRQATMKALREQVAKQGGQATPEQQKLAQSLKESEQKDKQDMAKVEQYLGPTDPAEFQSAMADLNAKENAAGAPGTAGQSAGGQFGGGQYGTGQSSGSSAGNDGPSPGLYYAYLVDANSHTPTHMLTFANAAAANAWYQQSAAAGGVSQVSPQMYMYSGAAPRPAGNMACMPISTVQPILPLQRVDGYPICCKSGPTAAGPTSTGGAYPSNMGPTGNQGTTTTTGGAYPAGNQGSTTNNNTFTNPQNPTQAQNPYVPQQQAAPPRKKLTFEDAAKVHAQSAKANGDPRPMGEIYHEALNDLKDQCPKSAGQAGGVGGASAARDPYDLSNTTGNSVGGPTAGGFPGGGGLGAPANNLPGGLGGATNGLPGGVGGAASNLPGGVGGATNGLPGGLGGAGGAPGGGDAGGGGLLGGLGGGLLGGSQGLNVAGLVGIGSDEKAAIDLSPAEKKDVKLKKAQELQRQQQIQQQQMKALEDQIKQQNGQITAQQQAQLKELQERDAATKQVAAKLREQDLRDQQQEAAGGGLPLPGGLPGVDAAKGLTNGLPVPGGLPGTDAVGGLANGLPAAGAVGGVAGGLPVAGGLAGGLLGGK